MLIKKIIKVVAHPRYALFILANNYIKFYENFSYDFHNNGESQLLKRLGDFNLRVVFDIGANVGEWTKMASKSLDNASFHCFEMVPETFATLSKNLNDPRFHLNCFGLSEVNSTVDYKYYGPEVRVNKLETRSVFHDHRMSFEIRTTDVIKGDNYCEKEDIKFIDLLKIDVEGAELLVLKGFENLIKQQRVRIIQFEYGYTHGDSGSLMRDFYDFLTQYGYVIGPLKHNGVWFMKFKYGLNDFTAGPNFVAVLENDESVIEAISHQPIKGYPRI